GWIEPGQRPTFDEYTVILRGVLRVEFESGELNVHAGQAVLVPAGTWVRYSTPANGGSEYIAVCVPAFSPESVHRFRRVWSPRQRLRWAETRTASSCGRLSTRW